ncbi:MAG: Tm-1-like ATP-binding domain-containing protein [Planctomycetota bacterium]
MNTAVYAIATMDTKGNELQFVAETLRSVGVPVRTIDVGTLDHATVPADIGRDKVLDGAALLTGGDRGTAVSAMAVALRRFLAREFSEGRLSGVIGIGGSGGTALITPAMRELPIGIPKVMVSTVASGNTAPYVDSCDITMMYSVVDVAGLNVVSRTVLRNAAHAMAGMVKHATPDVSTKQTLGMTMFGVTTSCVTAVRQQLEADGYDCLVFHATGAGGRAMENLVRSGLINGVLDITTTEVADEVIGGVFPAGPYRFEVLLEKQIPLLLSVGAVDMVNFGAKSTVPKEFRERRLHVHNEQVTLMRTTPDENRQIARWMATKLNRSTSPVTLVVPKGGVSAIDAPGQPFYDPEANAALFDELRRVLNQTSERRLVFSPLHINDPKFAEQLLSEYKTMERRVGN